MSIQFDISQSQINKFRKCPYAYYLHYIEKKEPMFYDDSVFEVGKRVHEAIEKYYKGYNSCKRDKDDILVTVYKLLRDDWDTKLPAEYLTKAYTCLEGFSNFEYDKQQQPRDLMAEVKIRADGIYGKIDYLDKNTWEVIDFKTNTRAGLGYDIKLQAMMYKTLVKHKFNIDIDYFTFEFLYTGENREVVFNNKIEKIYYQMQGFIKKIQEARRRNCYPKEPRTENMCKYCEYRYYCEGKEGGE